MANSADIESREKEPVTSFSEAAHGSSRHADIGQALFQQALEMDPERREAVAKRVRAKVDGHLLSLMVFMYFLAFLDKQTLNYANAFSLQKDLALQNYQYSWVATALNFGILVFIYPFNLCLQKFPIGRFVGICITGCGVVLIGMGFARTFSTLFALRFLLGGMGCGINPAWILLSAMFWTKEEQPWRMGLWLGFNGVANMIGAALSYGLSFAHAHLATWQLIFIVVGAVSAAFGVMCFFVMPSDPSSALFLMPEERAVSVWRVRRNRTGTKNAVIQWHQVREALADCKVLLLALQTFSLGILIGSITNFASAILLSFGFSSVNAALLQMPAGAFELVACIIAGLVVSRFRNVLVITIIVCLLPGLAGLIGIAVIPLSKAHQWALIGCAWLEGIFSGSIIMTYCLATTNIAGHSKRTTVNTIIFLCFAAGEIVGPFLFFPSEAPRYLTAIKVLCGMYAAAILFSALIGIEMLMANRRRDRAQTDADEVSGDIKGFSDITDLENESFRYRV